MKTVVRSIRFIWLNRLLVSVARMVVLALSLGKVVFETLLTRASTVQIISSTLFVTNLVWTALCWMVVLLATFIVRRPSVTIVLKPSVVSVLTARQLLSMFRVVGRVVQVLVGALQLGVVGWRT